MPELPEVETIRRGLEKYIVGYILADVEILAAGIFHGDEKLIIGGTINGVRRYGKGLVIDLDNGYSLAVHVKMTGRLVVRRRVASNAMDKELLSGRRQTSPVEKIYKDTKASKAIEEYPDKWTRVIFKLKVKSEKLKVGGEEIYLYYSDVRKFGWVQVVKTKNLNELPFFAHLGPEPLRDLGLETFRKILAQSNMPVKSVLMDQHRISGIGNIYANDALFLAKILPDKRASMLTIEESKQLLEVIEEVLQKSIAVGGASANNYVNALGEKGAYQGYFLVYDKKGKPCPRCGKEIIRIVIGGRGTFYCEECQK